MGRDDHNTSKGKKRFAQTPKNQLTDNKYVELSEDLAGHDDKGSQARSQAAHRKKKKNS